MFINILVPWAYRQERSVPWSTELSEGGISLGFLRLNINNVSLDFDADFSARIEV